MQRSTRRELLLGTGAVGLLTVAGCRDTTAAAASDGAKTTDPDDGVTTSNDPTIEIIQFEGGNLATNPATEPLWEDDRTGFITMFDSPEDGKWLFDSQDGRLIDWYTETDFDNSLLYYIESVGPNSCTRTLDIDDIVVTDGTLTGTVTVLDTSDPRTGCRPAITYPAALIRVTGTELPETGAMTVTDGWGDTETVKTGDPVLTPDSLPGSVWPEGNPEPVPADVECANDAFEPFFDDIAEATLEWGEATDGDMTTFAMRGQNLTGQNLTVRRGDELQVTLRNVSGKNQPTAAKDQYSLQRYTEDGWESIRVATVDVGYSPTDVVHAPGDGFEWTIRMTEDGLLGDHPLQDQSAICPEMRAGRYRFVFWGLDEGSLAVAFDYSEANGTVGSSTDLPSDIAYLDRDGDGDIDRADIVSAIVAFNTGGTINGQTVSRSDIVSAIVYLNTAA